MSAGMFALVVALATVGAAVGVALRFLLDQWLGAWGVLTANTAASFLAGVVTGVTVWASSPAPVWAPAVLTAGVAFVLALGTFSTVAADAAEHVLDGRVGRQVAPPPAMRYGGGDPRCPSGRRLSSLRGRRPARKPEHR